MREVDSKTQCLASPPKDGSYYLDKNNSLCEKYPEWEMCLAHKVLI